jgi:NAD(P)-dependent dehydrogenase (short-subunit alcohol dehydrogenase family)
MKKLTGKIAVISGGSTGIGLAAAERFVQEGAQVVITSRNEKDLKEAAARIGGDVTYVACDVSKLEHLDRLYSIVRTKFGHLDIVLANAASVFRRRSKAPRKNSSISNSISMSKGCSSPCKKLFRFFATEARSF